MQEVLTESHGPEGEGRTSALLDKTKGIEEILARDHMKVKIIILLFIILDLVPLYNILIVDSLLPQ